jgi:geranylgeranyl pyrophosphate synthase
MSMQELPARPVQADLEAAAERLRSLLADMTAAGPLAGQRHRYLQPAVEHLFERPGKLLRPLLVLLAARATSAERSGWEPARREAARAGTATPAVVRAAAAVELIHTASLAHDDMVDSAAHRRGAPSLHVAHGSTTAILVGDLLYARFFLELAALPGVPSGARLRLLEAFLGVTRTMCEGEIVADQMQRDGVPCPPGVYLEIVEAKTARLLSACCFAGALLAGADEQTVTALAGYGRSLGLLFQIADDLADGDCPCADRDALAAAADEARRSAAADLDGLPESDALAALRSLPDLILSPSRA